MRPSTAAVQLRYEIFCIYSTFHGVMLVQCIWEKFHCLQLNALWRIVKSVLVRLDYAVHCTNWGRWYIKHSIIWL